MMKKNEIDLDNFAEDLNNHGVGNSNSQNLQPAPTKCLTDIGKEEEGKVLCDHDESEFDDNDNSTVCSYFYLRRQALKGWFGKQSRSVKLAALFVCICLYLAYFSYAMYLHYGDSAASGLFVVTAIIFIVLLVKWLPEEGPLAKFHNLLSRHPVRVKYVERFLACLAVLTVCVTMVTEVILIRPANLVSLTGIAVIFFVFFITSTHPHRVNWRPVVSGLILQYILALLIHKVPAVRSIFTSCGDIISLLVTYAKAGSRFLYGDNFNYTGIAFQFIPLIVFIVCILTVLEHLGVLHVCLKVAGRFLAYCTGASAAEALNASANIFMGPLDSLILIRPILKYTTPSQLHCFMANGLSTVAGSTMGLFVLLGVSGDHLIAASVMSAPAALSLAKLAVPETRKQLSNFEAGDVESTSRYRSIMDAASSGAMSAMTLCASIIANATAVVSVMEMINSALTWLGRLVDVEGLTLQAICSYLYFPLALALGVDFKDGRRVAELLGVKTFLNELIAYVTLGQLRQNRMKFEEYLSHNYTDWSLDTVTNDVTLHGWNVTLPGGFLSERSEVIATYALCGFANFISVGIIMGCYLVLIPEKKTVVFGYVLRSMVVGHCASFLTACIAGLLYQ